MEQPLWIDEYAPSLSALPQPDVRDRLQDAVGDPVNLVLHGPVGSGKTAAVRALAEAAHEDPDNDLIEINVADFFDRTKSEIREDPRFAPFLQGQTEFSKQYRRSTDKTNKYKRDWSKRGMVSHVLKEQAGYSPSSGQYKTILLDNAEAIRED
ncbi:MAG: AAA family ATPase, partial [Halanaeroarchaeum sp.]